jgi:hypothetical protein
MAANDTTVRAAPGYLARAPELWYMSQASWFALRFILLILLTLPAVLPFFLHGLPQAFDSGTHFARLGVLDYHVRHGEFFPRWIPEMQLGYGYPVFNFYAPAAYYICEAFLLLGVDPYLAMVMAFVLAIWLAGMGMYLWASGVFGERSHSQALISAVAYAYSPYLLLNAYIRGSIAEVWAMSLLPWVFWSFHRLVTAQMPIRRLPMAALTLGALALTHNIVLMLVAPVLAVYVIVAAWRQPQRFLTLRAAGLSILLAMGVSAFFWLPMILERRDLTGAGIEIARNGWLPANTWQWTNFLDWSPAYRYTFERPVRLGIWQLTLGVAGLIWGRRYPREIWILATLALGLGFSAGAWALPIWQSTDILTLIQFPWRLLAVISPVLALLTGGVVARLAPRWRSSFGAAVVLLVIIVVHSPRLNHTSVFARESVDISLPNVAQVETFKGAEDGGEGTSSIQEFRPRWAGRVLVLEPLAAGAPLPSTVAVQRGGPFGLEFSVATAVSTTLRFTGFYFPGWKLHAVDGQSDPQVYPSTNLGVVSADIPPGEYRLRLAWEGTPIRRVAALLSLTAVLALAVLSWQLARRRAAAAMLLLPFAVGVGQTLYSPPLQAIHTPDEALATRSLELLGYRYEQDRTDRLYVYPYWFVRQISDKELRVRWALYDSAGLRLVEYASLPHYNSYRASNWPPGTLVDDAYSVPLPPGLMPGTYTLAAQIESATVTATVVSGRAFSRIGEVIIRRGVPQQISPRVKTEAIFDGRYYLEGFNFTGPPRRAPPSAASATVLSGQTVSYALYWRALDTPIDNPHGFVHLVGADGVAIAQVDQLPGPFFQPPMLWNRVQLAPDVYRLRIPDSTPSGLYYPYVGLYEFADGRWLSARTPEGAPAGDQIILPPIKVLGPQLAKPTQPVRVDIGHFARFLGFSTTPPLSEIRAGLRITVTLYYESIAPVDRSYTRFLHIDQEGLGMVAQQDGLPGAGSNPTHAWIPGEVIADTVTLSLPADLRRGTYTFYLGFYDPDMPASRVRLSSPGGDVLIQDDRAQIGDVRIP